VSPPISGHQKIIQFQKYREAATQWHRVPIEATAAIDAMCLAPQMAWVLCDSVVRGVPLNGFDTTVAARLAVFGSGSLALYREGAVAGFPTAGTLFFVNGYGHVRATPVHYRGITCVATVGDGVVCGISQSGTVRLINVDGRDERAFVGHCGPVLGVERMSEVLFASRAEDETVRIWDLRQRNPVSSVLLPHVSVCSIAGSSTHLICGFHNKRIGVVELRKDHGKAVLGVQTQDYLAVAMSYDSAADHLAMFGVVEKEPIQNSMVFVDNDGQSRQRVFRRYTSFLGTDAGRP
jgi:WD40 repeat protein